MTYRERHEGWARRTFGHAKLGDHRRVQRLIAMAARVWERPAGIVTQVFDDDAEREGAFRSLRDKIEGDLKLRGMSVNTRKTYLICAAAFVKH